MSTSNQHAMDDVIVNHVPEDVADKHPRVEITCPGCLMTLDLPYHEDAKTWECPVCKRMVEVARGRVVGLGVAREAGAVMGGDSVQCLSGQSQFRQSADSRHGISVPGRAQVGDGLADESKGQEKIMSNDTITNTVDSRETIDRIEIVEDIITGKPFVRVYCAGGDQVNVDLLYGEYAELNDVTECDAVRTVLTFFPGATIDPDYIFSRERM